MSSVPHLEGTGDGSSFHVPDSSSADGQLVWPEDELEEDVDLLTPNLLELDKPEPRTAAVDDDSSLEALLDESLGASAPANDLDSLLEESIAIVRETAATKAAQLRLKRGGQSAMERAADEARIAAWQAAHEWDTVANVAFFHDHFCESCKTSQHVFAGLFVREVHKHVKTGQRWRAVESSLAALPNEVALREIKQPLCVDCAQVKGWNFEEAYIWER